MSAFDLALARKAHKLSKGAPTGRELADKLGVRLASEAHRLAAVGRRISHQEACALTDGEMLLLRCLAAEERALTAAGEVRSPKTVDVSWRARKSDGWTASTAAKRMGPYRKGSDGRFKDGLNLLTASRNGHCRMMPAGWALIHAIEANQVPA